MAFGLQLQQLSSSQSVDHDENLRFSLITAPTYPVLQRRMTHLIPADGCCTPPDRQARQNIYDESISFSDS